MLRPWDMQPGESPEDFQAFEAFLSFDGSIAQFARSHVSSRLAAPAALAARFRWRARKACYLQAMAREREDATITRSREIGAEHAEALADIRTAAIAVIREEFARGGVDVKTALRALAWAVEIERLDSGKPTARAVLDLSGKTDAELDALEALLSPAPATKPAASA